MTNFNGIKQTSPPHEYTALHQHGNREGSGGAAGAIVVCMQSRTIRAETKQGPK